MAGYLFRNILAVLVIAASLLPLGEPAEAQEHHSLAGIPDYWSVQFENDYFAMAGDAHYTHGTEISWLRGGTGPGWLRAVGRKLPFFHLDEEISAVSYTLGQKIFTPEDLEQSALIVDDRPYAGYLYFGVSLLSRVYEGTDLFIGNALEVTVGIVGPDSGAAGMQEWVHQVFDSENPRGWDNQLGNEPTIGLSYTRHWHITRPGPGELELGIKPHVTAEIGNVYTYGAGGVMFQVGNNLEASFSPPNIRPGFPGVSFFMPTRKFSWYLFAGHESRLVARDIFLDGNTFEDSHSVRKEILVGDYQYGLVLHKGKFRLSLSTMLRTKEFEEQNELTRYGAFNLSFTL